jgi:uncharacterized membrane protein
MIVSALILSLTVTEVYSLADLAKVLKQSSLQQETSIQTQYNLAYQNSVTTRRGTCDDGPDGGGSNGPDGGSGDPGGGPDGPG